MAQNTAVITVYDMGVFEAKLAQVAKKAAKAGVAAPTFEVLEEVMVKKSKQAWDGLHTYEVFSHYEVEVVFEEIALPGGWRLVGVIDHTENLVRSVPDVEFTLSPFVERGPICDHCGKIRQRSETFILVDEDGKVMQVGRQCLGLFLGIDPERALAQVEMIGQCLVIDEEWTGRPKAKGVELEFFLAHCAAMIRTAGWRSRTTAQQNGTQATADMALENMLNQEMRLKDKRTREALWTDPSVADGETAKATALWMAELGKRGNLSDYMLNLAQIGENGFCTAKSAGFAASGINAYLKEREEAIKQASKRAEGVGAEWLGAVGVKLTVVAQKVSSAGFDTEYGYTFIHKFIAEGGFVLSWRTQTEVENGKYKLSGTVKKLGEFRGERQTEVTRCKLGLAG